LDKKTYVSALQLSKQVSPKKLKIPLFSNIIENRPKILIFVKHVLKIWNIGFLVQLKEVYPAITKKEKEILLKF
jgi:hypothetical protein